VVPDLPTLSLTTEQQKALAANLQAIPAAERIGAKVDLFNQQQVDQMLEHVIPNYKSLTQTISQQAQQMAQGQIPTDVQNVVQQSDAAKAIGGGTAGSGFGRNLVARDFGLTSLGIMQQGISTAENWMQTANSIYAPGMFNITSMFVSPQQMAAFDTQERNAQFQKQWMQNQIAAMPDPTTVGLWNASWSVVDAALSAYTGSSVSLGLINPQGTMQQTSGLNLGNQNAFAAPQTGYTFGGQPSQAGAGLYGYPSAAAAGTGGAGALGSLSAGGMSSSGLGGFGGGGGGAAGMGAGGLGFGI